MQSSIYKQDLLIKDLTQPIKDLLLAANLPWLNSLEFCTDYAIQPAHRILLSRDDEKIHQVVFYRLTKRVILPFIEIVGFPDIINQDIQELIKTCQVQLAAVNRLEQAVQPNEQWHPTQRNVYCQSYITIAKLPPTKEAYLSLLGKNKREKLPYHWRKLNRHFDNDIEIHCDSTNDIQFDDILQLEYLNKERRAGKGKGVDSDNEIQKRQQQRWSTTQAIGLLITLRHNGKIICGTLNYLYRNEAFLIVIAHDSAYENLNVGTLCLWKTIECLIAKGFNQYNFLWGRQIYKTQFLGVEYPWSIHVVSPHKWLAIAWKFQIRFKELYIRAWRFAKTRMGNNFFTTTEKNQIIAKP